MPSFPADSLTHSRCYVFVDEKLIVILICLSPVGSCSDGEGGEGSILCGRYGAPAYADVSVTPFHL